MTIDNLKTRLGIAKADASQDDLLDLMLTDAQALFKDYCNREDIPAAAESAIGRLAVVLYSRNADQYRQGSVVGAYSNTNFALGDDIPKSISKQFDKFQIKTSRAVKFI